MSRMENEQRERVLSPSHPRWQEFIEKLGRFGSETGCDGHLGPKRYRNAIRAMAEMGGDFDIEETFKFFEDHGGYCDCEIVLNVDGW